MLTMNGSGTPALKMFGRFSLCLVRVPIFLDLDEEGLVFEFLETGQASSEAEARQMAIDYAELEVCGSPLRFRRLGRDGQGLPGASG